jgi:activating signal cointegrator complex subunit 1
MSLSSIDRVSEAIGFLQTLDLKAVAQQALPEKSGENQSSLRISLRSLVSMHPPRRTSILYAEPSDPSNILQPISIQLRDAFSKAGFLVPDDRRLKLHATILNTIYAKASRRSDNTGVSPASTESAQNKAMDESKHKSQNEADNAPDTSRGHGRNAKAPIQLDATSIIEECRDFNWASDFALEKIAICKMGATKIKDEEGNVIDEQYEEVASIPFEI